MDTKVEGPIPLRPVPSSAEEEPVEEGNNDATVDKIGIWLLALQHASGSFGYRAAEFAFPLFFIELFTKTLLPASIYGFVTTGAAIIFSGSVGHTLDGPSSPKAHRRSEVSSLEATEENVGGKDPTYQLRLIRNFILLQKLLVAISYALFLILFLQPGLAQEAENGGRGVQAGGAANARPWTIFAAITLVGCGVILCNVGISVGIERAWVTLIARSDEGRLVRLNAIMRRIDLLSKLLAPLAVSLLTSVTSYPISIVVLLCITVVTAIFEWIWIEVVYKRFPELSQWEHRERENIDEADGTSTAADNSLTPNAMSVEDPPHAKGFNLRRAISRWAWEQWQDWSQFAKMPIFISTCSIALLYLSVLSFDSTFIAYLKSETTYSNGFIAGMRGVGVVAGLLGTMAMPLLERLVGIVRAGSYSLFAQVLPLIMSLVSLYVGADKRERPAWNGALLFSGLALSRIGLWSFDLAQLAQVQRALDRVRRKNALMGVQFALQNLFDLGHFALTIGWHRPDQFKYAATVSFGAVICATVIYVVFYARRLRGHLVHLDRLGLDQLLRRKRR
ncbi:hypothetical protein CF319_g5243 [Tilletia indica]|nr:hypothetical protein CF319_g5243 [Tilletia indica]